MKSPGPPTDSWSQEDGVAMTVIEAVAAAEGVDATALRPPLSEAIDPDALEQLLLSADDGTTVEFEYRNWMVEVRVGGDVTLRER